MVAPRGFEPRLTDSKSAVLPLDEGAAARLGEDEGEGNGAEDGTRTRDPHLGKVMLYQLSHFRSVHATGCWCREPESNWRHRDFQSRALPTELSRPGGPQAHRLRRRPENSTSRRARAAARPGWTASVQASQRRQLLGIHRPIAGELTEPVDPIDDRRMGREH